MLGKKIVLTLAIQLIGISSASCDYTNLGSLDKIGFYRVNMNCEHRVAFTLPGKSSGAGTIPLFTTALSITEHSFWKNLLKVPRGKITSFSTISLTTPIDPTKALQLIMNHGVTRDTVSEVKRNGTLTAANLVITVQRANTGQDVRTVELSSNLALDTLDGAKFILQENCSYAE